MKAGALFITEQMQLRVIPVVFRFAKSNRDVASCKVLEMCIYSSPFGLHSSFKFLIMQITYYGHSCFGIEIEGKHLLFDPFITGNELAKHISLKDIRADFILLSHGHSDHTADVEALAKDRKGCRIISNYEIVSWFEKKGIPGHPMNFGGAFPFGFGKVKMVQAIHSSVLADGTYAGNPGGFVIESKEGNIYYAGDTALSLDMQLIPPRTRLDLAILPIGSNFTMDYTDAAVAADYVRCNQILGMHYDTFGYIRVDHAAAKRAFAERGKLLTLMEVGETRDFKCGR